MNAQGILEAENISDLTIDSPFGAPVKTEVGAGVLLTDEQQEQRDEEAAEILEQARVEENFQNQLDNCGDDSECVGHVEDRKEAQESVRKAEENLKIQQEAIAGQLSALEVEKGTLEGQLNTLKLCGDSCTEAVSYTHLTLPTILLV